LNETLTVLQMD